MIERTATELSLTTQTELLSLNRSSLYYVPQPVSPDELYLKRRIDEIYTAHPFYGSRKITAVLRQERVINRKAVQRHTLAPERKRRCARDGPGRHLPRPEPE